MRPTASSTYWDEQKNNRAKKALHEMKVVDLRIDWAVLLKLA